MAELDNNGKHNVLLETIRAMTEREIAYKESIDKRINGIRTRQIIGIVLSFIIMGGLAVSLTLSNEALQQNSLLIKVLIGAFRQLNN